MRRDSEKQNSGERRRSVEEYHIAQNENPVDVLAQLEREPKGGRQLRRAALGARSSLGSLSCAAGGSEQCMEELETLPHYSLLRLKHCMES